MASNATIKLSGKAYCDWNAFSWYHPAPKALAIGDLVVWAWAGDVKSPQSKVGEGRFEVSVFDGKKRRRFTVRNTVIHRFLNFSSTEDGRRKTVQILLELLKLKGENVEWCKGKPSGYEVALPPEVPPETNGSPKEAPAAKIADAAPVSNVPKTQCEFLFE